jgi:hypothetical protein
MEHLTLIRHTAEGLKGGLLYWTLGYERKALGTVSLLMGAKLGNLEWAPLPRTLRDG